jgi:superfamily II DNA or RNA helicase
MILNPSKTARQELGISNWRSARCKGTLNYIMGFGKTRIATEVTARTLAIDRSRNIIAIAPNAYTRDNLQSHLDYAVNSLSAMEVLNILKNNPLVLSSTYMVVIDEIHKFLTPEFSNILHYFFLQPKCYKLGLTGSTLTPDIKNKLSAYGFPVVDSITEVEALNNRWISPYREYDWNVTFSLAEQEMYSKLSAPITELGAQFRGMQNVLKGLQCEQYTDIIYACLAGRTVNGVYVPANAIRAKLAEYNGYIEGMQPTNTYNAQRIKYWKPDNIKENAKLYKACVDKRYNLINRNKTKLNAVLAIIKANDVPTIIFNDNINMCEDIVEALGDKAIAFHTKIESRPFINPITNDYYKFKNGNTIKFGYDRLKKLIIDGVINGTYKYLVCAQALNEGLNIPSLQQVICTAGSTNPLSYAQRTARGKRIDDDNSSKITTIINIYHGDFSIDGKLVLSRDKQKLFKRQEQNEQAVTYINSIEDIEF